MRKPVAHDFEHLVQAPHGAMVQSTGQALWLQEPVAKSFGHGTPPFAGGLTTERARVLVPPPQDALQLPHAPQDETTQGVGHGRRLHERVCDLSDGHFTPPNAAVTFTDRLRVCEPFPHVCEHTPHLPHTVISQSTGHAVVPHCCMAVVAPHATPPCAGAVAMPRLRLCKPPPHVFEQAVHVDQSDILQSTGHALL